MVAKSRTVASFDFRDNCGDDDEERRGPLLGDDDALGVSDDAQKERLTPLPAGVPALDCPKKVGDRGCAPGDNISPLPPLLLLLLAVAVLYMVAED